MIKKNISRLLALVLVLCMVVVWVPVRAEAVDMTRPEGLTDEEWDELLRQRLLEEAAESPAPLTQGSDKDPLTESSSGNLVVTEEVTAPGVAAEDEQQSVSVELPLDAEDISEDKTENEYTTEVTLPGSADPTEVTVTESFDLKAEVTTTETTPDGEVTDITYNVALDEHITAVDGGGNTVIDNTITNVDKVINSNTQTPSQFQVSLTVNGMENAPTRVEHRYTETEGGEEKVEYYYNADTDYDETDTTRKYFTTSGFDKQEEESTSLVQTVTNKVISLWTSFLGLFHVTNDAFEGSAKADGTKDTYDNLTAAAAANNGETVEMLRDYETDASATIENNVTVDLNGHSYTNTSEDTAIQVTGDNHKKIIVQDGAIISNGDGVNVGGSGNKFSLLDIFHLKSNNNRTTTDNSAAIKVSGSGNTVDVVDSFVDGSDSKYGIRDTSTSKNTVNITGSGVVGKTGVALSNTDATITDSYVAGSTGAAVAVSGNTANNDVIITSGWFESGKNAHDISTKGAGDAASVTVKGGRFNDPVGLYSYVPEGYAVISHNDGQDFPFEVVPRNYVPTRTGYRFLGYTDANGNAITLAKAFEKGYIAYAQWKAIPQAAKVLSVYDLISAKTDEKGCTTKITVKGDTAFVTVKDAKGEIVPISEVKISSVKQLQNLKIDTIEIQVDEDVTLVLDIEEAKKNGFVDTIEVTLDKDTLLITSGKDTCIELDIAVLKASDKPVEIQLVESELTVMLGKSSSLSVDLTKALKTGERIVVKLQNGVLKLYDKYNKPIKEK